MNNLSEVKVKEIQSEKIHEKYEELQTAVDAEFWKKLNFCFQNMPSEAAGGTEQLIGVQNGTNGIVLVRFLKLRKGKNSWQECLNDTFRSLGRELTGNCGILLEGFSFTELPLETITEILVRAMYYGAYSFRKERLQEITVKGVYSLREELKDEKASCRVTLITGTDLKSSIKKAVDYGECINYARMLGDIPSNYLHTSEFTGYLKKLAKDYGIEFEALGQKELSTLHCGGILGVNSGSKEEAVLISLYYEGEKGAPITALVGKGVMFDSGGYHLKSLSSMEGMKYDMCGAANLAAAFEIVLRQKSKINLLLLIPAVENLIGPDALRMGDVITTMSGKTVEVYNTDAEGRLILCDALTYAQKRGAGRILDLATLTNSCRKALGDEISGIFYNDDTTGEAFMAEVKHQGEKVWRLPLDQSYHRLLYRTQTADLINYAPEGDGGASVAACFLEEFIEEGTAWIHLDIVGTSVNRSADRKQVKGASGVLAASVAAFLIQQE